MVQKTFIIGRLGKDPETRNTDNGTVANFSVAVSEVYKDKNGEKKEITEWFNIVLWKGLADIAAKYLKKGSLVYIEGKMRTRTWEKDGVKRYTTELIGNELKMLGDKSSNSAAPSPSPGDGPKDDTDGDGSLPF